MEASTTPVRNARGRAQRDKILRATLKLIGERGIHATTHRAVAEEAAVPVGAPSYYFGGIDELLEEALLLFVSEEVARLQELAGYVTQLDAPSDEMIAELFAQAVADVHVGQPLLVLAQFQLYLEAARRPVIQAAAARCQAAYRELARGVLTATGRDDDELIAGRFVAMCDGLGLHRLAEAHPRYADEVLRPALLHLLRCAPRLSP